MQGGGIMNVGGAENSDTRRKKVRRPSDENRHFNQPSKEAALEYLKHSFSKLCGKNEQFIKVHPNPKDWDLTNESLWVEDERGRLGVRGIIFGMQLLWRLGKTELITMSTMQTHSDHETSTVLNLKQEQVEIRDLVNVCLKPNKPLTNYNRETSEREIIIAFARRTFTYLLGSEEVVPTEDDLDKLYGELIHTSPQKPEDVYNFFHKQKWLSNYKYLSVEVEQKQINRSRGAHYIGKRFTRYLSPNGELRNATNSPEYAEMAKELIDRLKNNKMQNRPALLYGPVNAGKSGVIVEVLRKMERDCKDHDTIGLCLDDTSIPPEPVIVINVRNNSQHEVAKLVLDALYHANRQPQHRHENKKIPDDPRSRFEGNTVKTTTQIRQQIDEELKKYEGSGLVFIFTNWDELGATTPRGLLRDIPNASLVLMLQRYKCRVLISTVGDMTEESIKVFRSQFAKITNKDCFQLMHPYPAQIEQYYHGTEMPDFDRNLVNQLPKKRRLPGAHLILIAAVMQYCEIEIAGKSRPNSATEDAFKTYVEEVKKLKIEDEVPNYFIATFFDVIMSELENQGALNTFLAIVASDDGLRHHSIKQLNNPWNNKPGQQNCDIDTVTTNLNKLAQGFFIPLVTPALAISKQFTAYEIGGDDNDRTYTRCHENDESSQQKIAKQQQFELNHTLRESLISLITDEPNSPLAKYKPKLRLAFKSIAAIARRRSRNWRLQEPLSCLTRDYRFMLADIQCYEAILAGINPKNLENKTTCKNALDEVAPFDIRCTQVLGSDEPHHEIHHLRYAVIDLLIGGLDGKQHNLTMRYDIDGLRTRLYLSVFTAVGRREFRSIRDLTIADLPNKIPKYSYYAFSHSELLKIIEAIALSAFHHQCPDIVQWCLARENEIIVNAPEAQRENLYISSNRILCSAVDMSILLGHPITYRQHKDEPKMLEVLEDRLSAQIVSRYPEMEDWFNSDAILPLPEQSLDYQRNWLRLKARYAELLDINNNNELATETYLKLWKIDQEIARSSGGYSGLGVLSGRPGRAMAVILARASVTENDPENVSNLRVIIQRILDGEIGRLSSYGGAERIAIVVTMGEVHKIHKGLDKSLLNISRQARASVDEERVSLRTRLLAIDFFLRCEIENYSKDTTDIDLLIRDAKLYASMAEALGFGPQKIKADGMLAQLKSF